MGRQEIMKSSQDLRDQLEGVRLDILTALKSGDDDILIGLWAKRAILPVKIRQAVIREAEMRLAELAAQSHACADRRSRCAEERAAARARLDNAKADPSSAEVIVDGVPVSVIEAFTEAWNLSCGKYNATNQEVFDKAKEVAAQEQHIKELRGELLLYLESNS